MGCRIVHAKEDGEDRGDRGADHHDGHDRPDVLGHERNGALSDVRAAQDEVDDTGIVIFLAKVLLAHNHGKGGDQRRNDAGGGNSSHEVRAKVVRIGANTCGESLGKHSGTGDVCGLVDRAAHVKGAHAANGQAQDNGTGGREALEEVHHGSIDSSHGTGDAKHNHTHNERGEQRVQENGLQTVEVLRQLGKNLLQQQDNVTRKETANDTAEEAEAHARATGVNQTGLG